MFYLIIFRKSSENCLVTIGNALKPNQKVRRAKL